MLMIDDDLWQAPLESNIIYNKKVKKNRDKSFQKESNTGLTKDDKDYLMGVIKSMQQVIEIQSSIIKNNQIDNNKKEIELIIKEIHKETKNIINNIVKNLSK